MNKLTKYDSSYGGYVFKDPSKYSDFSPEEIMNYLGYLEDKLEKIYRMINKTDSDINSVKEKIEEDYYFFK